MAPTRRVAICRENIRSLVSWKWCVVTTVAAIAFANVVMVLFGNTIPNILLMVFGNTIPGVFQAAYRTATVTFVLGAVLVFAMAWMFRARPHHRPRAYEIIIFDVYGMRAQMDGIRTAFKNHDVAWSYMKQYKEMYPLYNFALVSDANATRPTIYRYI